MVGICIALVWTPWAQVWGDDFMAAAGDGATTGTKLRNDVTLPAITAGNIQFSKAAGGSMRIQDLFPGSDKGTVTDFTAAFGQHDATVNAGNNTQQALTTANSPEGRAYRSLREAAARPQSGVGSAAMWSNTDAVIANAGDLTKQFADCAITSTFTEGTREVEIGENHACERKAPLPPPYSRMLVPSNVILVWPNLLPETTPVAIVGILLQQLQSNPLGTLLDPHLFALSTPDQLKIAECQDDEFCHPHVECAATAATSGHPFGVGFAYEYGWISDAQVCTSVSLTLEYQSSFVGKMECWTDTQGDIQCPTNHGGVNSCQAFDSDPNCKKESTKCVKGAQSSSGYCYVEEEIWNCPVKKEIPTLSRDAKVSCSPGSATPVRCIGAECADFEHEQSGDFAKAAAALQAAQMSASDMECTGSDCELFPGTEHQCKKAVSGVVNCCTTPGTGELTNYLELVFMMSRINNAMMGLDSTSAVRGAWEVLTGPISDAYTAVTSTFTSAAETLMGNTSTTLTDFGFKALMDEITQQILTKAAEWTAKIFGEAAANTLFVSAAGGPAVSGGVASSAGVTLAPMLASIISVVMWVYLIYQIVMILIKIIWKCTKDEFELGAKRDLKSCVFVGTYCRKKVIGYCIEVRQTFCCFNSPFSRIVQEQARPQLGRGWGVPEAPDCTGIRMGELQALDWNAINLDEWLAMLAQTGHFPNPNNVSLDRRTGNGSVLAGTEGRPDSANRSAERLRQVDVDGQRTQAETQLWKQIQSAPR